MSTYWNIGKAQSEPCFSSDSFPRVTCIRFCITHEPWLKVLLNEEKSAVNFLVIWETDMSQQSAVSNIGHPSAPPGGARGINRHAEAAAESQEGVAQIVHRILLQSAHVIVPEKLAKALSSTVADVGNCGSSQLSNCNRPGSDAPSAPQQQQQQHQQTQGAILGLSLLLFLLLALVIMAALIWIVHLSLALTQARQEIFYYNSSSYNAYDYYGSAAVDKSDDDPVRLGHSGNDNWRDSGIQNDRYGVDDHAAFKMERDSSTAAGGLMAHDLRNDTRHLVVPPEIMRRFGVEYVQMSPDGVRALLQSEVTPVFKYSELSIWRVWHTQRKTVVRLKPPLGHTNVLEDYAGDRLYFAEWAPDSQGIVFLYRTKLFWQPLPIKSEIPAILLHQYPDFLHRTVFLAMPDWSYEEDVWFSGRALAMDGGASGNRGTTKRVAFAVVYSKHVGAAAIPQYGEQNAFYQYPKFTEIKYPKAGSALPVVRLYVKNVPQHPTEKISGTADVLLEEEDTKNLILINPPEPILDEFQQEKENLLLAKFAWIPGHDGHLMVVWMNRAQNTSWYTVCKEPKHADSQEIFDYECTVVHTHKSKHWILLTKTLVFNKAGTFVLDIFPRNCIGDSERKDDEDAPYGIFQISTDPEKSWIHVLGSASVIPDQFGILHWYEDEGEHAGKDTPTSWVFYVGVPSLNTTQSHVYKLAAGSNISEDDRKPEEHHCLTCLLSNSRDQPCLYNLASFSPTGRYFAISCESPFEPPQLSIYEMHSFRKMVVLNDNQAVFDLLTPLLPSLPLIRDLGPFTLSKNKRDKGAVGSARLFLPSDLIANLDNNGTDGADVGIDPFPLVVHVYGAPDHKLITDSYLFNTNAEGLAVALASSHRIAVLFVDAVGSAYQPVKRIFNSAENPLDPESEGWEPLLTGKRQALEQLEAIRTVTELPFIDTDKVAIWGWSYGGFLAGHVMALDQAQTIGCGALVAPVVNWIYYSALYAERGSDLAAKPYLFRNKTLLLVHGSGDSNVHIENTMALVASLQTDGILNNFCRGFVQKLVFLFPYKDEEVWLLEDVKKRAEAMFQEALGIMEDGLDADGATGGWKLNKEGEAGAMLYSRKLSGSKRGKMPLPAEQFMEKFFSTEAWITMPQWNETILDARVLQTLKNQYVVCYESLGPVKLVTGVCPPVKGIVRAECGPCCVRVVPDPESPSTSSFLTWTVDMDFKLQWFPDAVFNQIFHIMAASGRVTTFKQRSSAAELDALEVEAERIFSAGWEYYCNKTDWKLNKEGANGAVIYAKKNPHPTGNKTLFKLYGRVELNQDLFVKKFLGMEEAESVPKWNTTMALVQQLQALGPETHIMYQATTAIGPGGMVSSRDVTLLRRSKKLPIHPDQGIKGGYKFVLCYASIKLDDVPAVKGRVRAECFPSLAVVEPAPDNPEGAVFLTWVVDMDLKLSYIPTAIFNQVFQYLLFDNMHCIVERSKKLAINPDDEEN
ncbi:unnamed protein product [Notodromas monacha]|uniref:START domain-containing protein n=1 Tax=Notodromas monacha TaxID=399045 RepID=A0A7R9G954_9CRUS|nr:unnamed protein product [Notodromas monacha]CAG0913896.1 unnamed protein product [Notodromas monacha]